MYGPYKFSAQKFIEQQTKEFPKYTSGRLNVLEFQPVIMKEYRLIGQLGPNESIVGKNT
jgi:hypothetical protein